MTPQEGLIKDVKIRHPPEPLSSSLPDSYISVQHLYTT